MLQKRTTSHALKAHTVEYLANETQSFEYTRGVIETLLKQIKDEVAELGGNRALETIIEALELKPTEIK